MRSVDEIGGQGIEGVEEGIARSVDERDVEPCSKNDQQFFT